MNKTKFLLIDDEEEQSQLLEEAVKEINAENEDSELSFDVAKNPRDAMIALYTNSYQAIITDLKLLDDDAHIDNDEKLSGNILLSQIIDKEIIPIIVRTGFPDKISSKIDQKIVKVYRKDEPLYSIIKELIKAYSDSIFKIFGSKGEINKNIKV